MQRICTAHLFQTLRGSSLFLPEIPLYTDCSPTCSGHVLAGPDWLKAHEGDLHGQDQTDDVEGAVGWRRGKKVNDDIITQEEESLKKKKKLQIDSLTLVFFFG